MTDGYGIPLGRVLAGANRHDSPLLAPTLDCLEDLAVGHQVTLAPPLPPDSGHLTCRETVRLRRTALPPAHMNVDFPFSFTPPDHTAEIVRDFNSVCTSVDENMVRRRLAEFSEK